MEVWKDVKNYEGYYQVSNLGNVKSVGRYVTHSNGISKCYRKGKILSNCINSKGYMVVILNKLGKRKTFNVHQLVAQSFLNHKINGFTLVVNHIDFNRVNNKLSNLEIVTPRHNSNRKHLKSSSIYTGVSLNKKTKNWISQISINGKTRHIGTFKTELEASIAYENKFTNIQETWRLNTKRN